MTPTKYPSPYKGLGITAHGTIRKKKRGIQDVPLPTKKEIRRMRDKDKDWRRKK